MIGSRTQVRHAMTALAVMLSACGSASEQLGPLGELAEVAASSIRTGRAEEPPLVMPEGAIPSDVLAQSPEPMIALTLGGVQRIILSAAPYAADDQLNFQDQNRRGIRMHEGAVSGTYGFGIDLLAVRFQRDDPVAHPVPLIQWPGQVDREYQYRQRDLYNYSIVVSCVFDRVVRENIEVIERYETVRIVETCTNQRRSFENTYWVEPESGVIRRSQQWTGPTTRPVIVELLRASAEG